MLNKRLLIKNLLVHEDEGTLYDLKLQIDINSDEGKSKFLKHICSFSNSNPNNEAYLIVGVANATKEIIGCNFLDDRYIQNLVRKYLTNPPIVKYENIAFPHLSTNRVCGLLTIRSQNKRTSFNLDVGKYPKHSCFYRHGSNSILIGSLFYIDESNVETVQKLKDYSSATLKQLLDDTFEFFKLWNVEYNPQYRVFQEQFVVCWAGASEDFHGEPYLSEVDLRILNEGTRIFYSACQWIKMIVSESSILITEYVFMDYGLKFELLPFERTEISFSENGKYQMITKVIFKSPVLKKEQVEGIYAEAKEAEEVYRNPNKKIDENGAIYESLAYYFLICYLNGYDIAKEDLLKAKDYLDGVAAESYSDCIRILNVIE